MSGGDYTTPGIYIEEVSTAPPSIIEIASAVPAFIGYTKNAVDGPRRIGTLLEFVQVFGGGQADNVVVRCKWDTRTNKAKIEGVDTGGSATTYRLYDALNLYFKNGGGPCYVASAGTTDEDITEAKLSEALAQIGTEDEPTLLVLTDAVALLDAKTTPDPWTALVSQAIAQCRTRRDRFLILDAPESLADPKDSGGQPSGPKTTWTTTLGPDIQASWTSSQDPAPQKPEVYLNKFGMPVSGFPKFEVAPIPGSSSGEKLQLEIAYLGSDSWKDIQEAWDKPENSYNQGPFALEFPASWGSNPPMPPNASETRVMAEQAAPAPSPSDLSPLEAFRKRIPPDNSMYGAAYYPWLETMLSLVYKDDDVKVIGSEPPPPTPPNTYTKSLPNAGDAPSVVTATWSSAAAPSLDPQVLLNYFNMAGFDPSFTVEGTGAPSSASNLQLRIRYSAAHSWRDIQSAWDRVAEHDRGPFSLDFPPQWTAPVPSPPRETTTEVMAKVPPPPPPPPKTLTEVKDDDPDLYRRIQDALANQSVTLPPSAAIAGVYAKVDRAIGPWKAPANIPLLGVVGLTDDISHERQGMLNVDTASGKSINAIRAFAGRGVVVWGARTLAGNSNEWRYISVRRLFVLVESEARALTSFAVFESNSSTTWLKVRGLLDSYLYGLWEQGALFGESPEQAYYVDVGLGKTMTQTDLLEGRMIVKVGLAAVRPAEFIVLQFTHEVQES